MNMKRFYLALLFVLYALGGYAQDMATLFSSMPDQYIVQLESAWRKDLIDLYNSGKEARLQNTMNGYSVLEKLTSDYLLLQSTERTTIEMKMLPLVNNTYIICMITTVSGPAPDSRIAFYTTDWQPLEALDLYAPVEAGWFIRESANKNSDAFLDATSRLDMDLVRYSLSPDANTLTATYATPLYLSKEEREKVKPFLKDEPKVYMWERSHFQ